VEYVDIRYSSQDKSYFSSNVLALFIRFDRKMLFSTTFMVKLTGRERDQPFSGEVVLCMAFDLFCLTMRLNTENEKAFMFFFYALLGFGTVRF
jgi:hypothetical protein